jgi:hypothetical protein
MRGEPNPYKNPYKLTRGNMPKPNPDARRAAQEMPKKIGGTMGSTPEQAKKRKTQALADMRKRGMLRKKQG